MVVRNLDEDVKVGLRRRARRHGRSTEAEAREVLRNAVHSDDDAPRRLGSRLASRFARIGLLEDIPELRGEAARPARLEP